MCLRQKAWHANASHPCAPGSSGNFPPATHGSTGCSLAREAREGHPSQGGTSPGAIAGPGRRKCPIPKGRVIGAEDSRTRVGGRWAGEGEIQKVLSRTAVGNFHEPQNRQNFC